MNRDNVITVKDRDGHPSDSILTSITNHFLIDNGTEIENKRLINLNDCNKLSQDLSRTDKMDDKCIISNNNNGFSVKAAFGLEILRPNHGRTRRNGPAAVPNQRSLTLDDFDLLNVNDLLGLDTADSWLYKASQKRGISVNLCDWLRDGFNDRESGSSGPSLLQKLDVIYPKKAQGIPARNTRVLMRPSRPVFSHKTSDSVRPSLDPADSSSHLQQEDSRQLNRTYNKTQLLEMVARMKKNDGVEEKFDDSPGESKAVRTSSGERQSVGKQTVERHVKSSGSLENCLQDAGQQKMVDVNDVQMLAKMQEDSLRKSFSCSSGRSLKSELNKSTGHLTDDCGPGSPLHRSTHSSPGRTYDLKEFRKPRDSLTSTSSGSSSPPESMLDVNASLHKNSFGASSAQQRSLPNLSKDVSSHELLPSEDRFERVSTCSDESVDAPSSQPSVQPIRRSGLKQPSKRPVMRASKSDPDSTSHSKESTVSAPRSGIPAPKVVTSIPRPNPSSKIRPPSKIATMRRVLTTPVQNDSSWREGCF